MPCYGPEALPATTRPSISNFPGIGGLNKNIETSEICSAVVDRLSLAILDDEHLKTACTVPWGMETSKVDDMYSGRVQRNIRLLSPML